MDVDVSECCSYLYHKDYIEFQAIQKKPTEEDLQHYHAEFQACTDAVPSKRSVRENLGEKTVSAIIKIIIFTDTILKAFIPEFLSNFFTSVDIDMVESDNGEALVQNVQFDHKVTHFIIIKSSKYCKSLIDRLHCQENVNTIYIYCNSDELKEQRRFARNFAKLDAVFDDARQVLIKLLLDLALFCEELADRQRDKPSSMQSVHKNYQTSIDLYAYAENILC